MKKTRKNISNFVFFLLTVIFFGCHTLHAYATSSNSEESLIQCTGKYALCDASDCLKSNSSSKSAECNCPVFTGENWGYTTCAERQGTLSNNQVYSTYSPRNLLGSSGTGVAAKKLFKPYKYCPENTASSTGQEYADCFNVLCTVSSGGKRANCPCNIITNKVDIFNVGFLVESNNCTDAKKLCEKYTGSNSKIVLNSGNVGINLKLTEKTLMFYGKNLDESIFCTPKDIIKQNAIESGVVKTIKKLKSGHVTDSKQAIKTKDTRAVKNPDISCECSNGEKCVKKNDSPIQN